MKGLQIEAVYENGVLKLPRELPFASGQKITITIHSTGSAAERLSDLLSWKGSREDLEYLVESDDNHLWATEA